MQIWTALLARFTAILKSFLIRIVTGRITLGSVQEARRDQYLHSSRQRSGDLPDPEMEHAGA
jgi:hypothetical protein